MDGIKSTGLAALQAYGGAGATQGLSAPNYQTSTIGTEGNKGDFGNILTQALDNLQQQGAATQSKSEALVAGQGNLVDVVTAIAETEVALETMVSVRDKVISAYEEILRMPI